MPNELTIPAVQATAAPGESPTGAKAVASVPASPPPTHFLANPSLRLDPALGLVVIEFRNDSGAVTSSIPSQRQIDAYRLHEQTPPGPDGPSPGEP